MSYMSPIDLTLENSKWRIFEGLSFKIRKMTPFPSIYSWNRILWKKNWAASFSAGWGIVTRRKIPRISRDENNRAPDSVCALIKWAFSREPEEVERWSWLDLVAERYQNPSILSVFRKNWILGFLGDRLCQNFDIFV